MQRREFVAFLGGLAIAAPRAAVAQTSAKVYRIALVSPGGPVPESNPNAKVLLSALAQLGYTLGQNLAFEGPHGALGQAVRLDPKYARAWAGKARAHLADFSGSPQAQYQKSMEAANKALALDENLADAHGVLCLNKAAYEWDFDGAERECVRAVKLDPNSSYAHVNYSRYLNGQGRSDAAIAEVKTAIDLEPTSLASQRTYGMILYYARRYPEALTQLKRVNAMDKGFASPYMMLVDVSEMQGNYPEAFEWLMKMKAFYKEPEEEIQAYQAAWQTSGWPGVLRERARRGGEVNFRPSRAGVYFQLAIDQAKVGNKDKAFEYLERSYQTREWWMMLLKVEPALDSVRQDPRFDQLVRRVGLR